MRDREIFSKLAEGVTGVLAIIIEAKGSTPRTVGSKMIICENGEITGSIGGGILEKQVMEEAKKLFNSKETTAILHYKLDTSERVGSLDALCGGNVTVYLELVNKKDEVIILGAGHVGVEIARVAEIAGFWVTVVDDREEFACKEKMLQAHSVIAQDFVEFLDNLSFTPNKYFVIVTRGHRSDKIVLKKILEKSKISFPAYIGMIGSRKKVKTIFNELIKEGISPEALSKVKSPIGINLGGDSPGEIAISVVAELLSVKYNTTPYSLSLEANKDAI